MRLRQFSVGGLVFDSDFDSGNCARVEAIGDELLVECGIYAGRGGLGEDGGWVPAATEGGDSEPRRAAARRYERNGRFASAFFVEESRMTAEELENEKEDGEGGKPLYF